MYQILSGSSRSCLSLTYSWTVLDRLKLLSDALETRQPCCWTEDWFLSVPLNSIITFKVHITNKSVLSSHRVLYSVNAHINDSCSFFYHICSDEVGNAFKKISENLKKLPKRKCWATIRTTTRYTVKKQQLGKYKINAILLILTLNRYEFTIHYKEHI